MGAQGSTQACPVLRVPSNGPALNGDSGTAASESLTIWVLLASHGLEECRVSLLDGELRHKEQKGLAQSIVGASGLKEDLA